jgi:hypothetical protein
MNMPAANCRLIQSLDGTRESAMLVVAKAIVVLVAIFFLILGVVALFRPPIARGFLLGFANNALKHYAELLTRILFGGSLLLITRNSAYATVLSAFGWLLIITSAFMALVPWRFHHRFTQSAVPKALRFLPLIGITSLVIGALLLLIIFTDSAA